MLVHMEISCLELRRLDALTGKSSPGPFWSSIPVRSHAISVPAIMTVPGALRWPPPRAPPRPPRDIFSARDTDSNQERGAVVRGREQQGQVAEMVYSRGGE